MEEKKNEVSVRITSMPGGNAILPQQPSSAGFGPEIPLETYAEVNSIKRDPYRQLAFAKKLIDYESEILDACWRMREHLDSARPYMNDSATFLNLIDQLEGMAAEMQRRAGSLGEFGRGQKKTAEKLIEVFEKFGTVGKP